MRFATVDGVSLEALGRFPAGAGRAVVLCHPHPLYGGTMHNALVVTFARVLAERGGEDVATLRFNFRGVEGSDGRHDGGEAELLDVLGAVDALRRELPETRLSLLGYSFGSWVALRAALEHDAVERVALVAPATRLFESFDPSRPRRSLPVEILCGDRDAFVHVPAARGLAGALGARLHLVEGADHLFLRHRAVAARTLLAFLAPEAAAG
jgi:alpha/beta superfamily hydrolase